MVSLRSSGVRRAAALSVLVLCAGCSPAWVLGPPRWGEPRAPQARLVSYHGWRDCCELSNGLVRVTSVPQVGGRTLEYALGESNFLFVGRGELGATAGEELERRYRYFGGHVAQLHPTSRWARLQGRSPHPLPTGRYTARLIVKDGVAAVEMASPVDLATGTRLVRRVELFAGSTHVRVSDTLTNGRLVPQQWGLHDIVQLKGYPSRSGILRGDERPAGAIGLYVPLSSRSQFPGGLRFVVPGRPGNPAVTRQWSSDRFAGLLVLRYRRLLSKVLVDPELPWVALVDRRSGEVFVQACPAPQKAILTAGGPFGRYPYIEVQCFGPVVRLEPGKSTTLVQHWYAARCPEPILDVTDAGVVASPLKLLRNRDGTTSVAGTFGVFCVGTAAVVFRDAKGRELARLGCGTVSPFRPLVLDRRVELPAGTAEVVLEVRDGARRPVGHLGRILLGSG